MYLQVFPVTDWSVLCTNSTFHDAVGTVGHFHIGIYARIFSLFLLDPSTRPRTRDMRLWVDAISFVKENAPGGELEFFTYLELCIWFMLFPLFRISRIRYTFYVLLGYGTWVEDPKTHKTRFQMSTPHLLDRLRDGSLSVRAHLYLDPNKLREQPGKDKKQSKALAN